MFSININTIISLQILFKLMAMVNRGGDFVKVNSAVVKSYVCIYSSLYNCYYCFYVL